MKPIDFIKAYHDSAKKAEESTGVNAIFSLAQAALESGWGDKAPGFAFFGIKDYDGLNGNEQLLPTVEYSRYPHLTAQQVGLKEIDRIEWSEASHQFIYHGKAYFRKYDSAEEGFIDHAKLFFKYDRPGHQPYSAGLSVIVDPEAFARAIAPIYASGPNYADLVISIMHSIKSLIQNYNL